MSKTLFSRQEKNQESIVRGIPAPTCQIHSLETPEELAQVIVLQCIVWPGSELEIAPSHVLLTAAHHGGLVAGAFIGDQLAGFLFSFLGFQQTRQGQRLKHCSHMLGVHPDFRGMGIGAALKIYQRGFVLGQGLDLITWTYDPLLARNARLNVAKLGAVCNTYLADLYGNLDDDLNAGLPTDRLQVDWWIDTPWVEEHVSGRLPQPGRAAHLAAGARILNPPANHGRPEPPTTPAPDAPLPATVLLEVPADFLALKAVDPAAALSWRLATRNAFRALFDRGYVIGDFVYEPGPPVQAAYVLSHAYPRLEESTR